MKDKDAPYYFVQSLDRALAILDLFRQERKPLGITEIAERLGVHKSSVHRMLATLQLRGYVEREPASERYWIGPSLLELGTLYMHETSLVDESKPFLQQLVDEVGVRAHLATLYDGMVLYLKHAAPSSSMRLDTLLGERTYVHCSALGKCLVAWKSEPDVQAIVDKLGMPAMTPRTIGSAEAFFRELRHVREQGYALDDEEASLGSRCIAAPIRNYTGDVIAAVSINGSADAIAPERADRLAAAVKRCAAAISGRLGGK